MTYTECLQKEINERKTAKVLTNLSPMELLAIARRPLPKFNRITGERV